MPAKISQIFGPFVAAEFEIEHTQERVSVCKMPTPLAALAFQTSEAGDFLLCISEPVAVGGKFLNFESHDL